MSEGYLLTSHDGEMWDLLKEIIKEAEGANSASKIKALAESGIERLKESAL